MGRAVALSSAPSGEPTPCANSGSPLLNPRIMSLVTLKKKNYQSVLDVFPDEWVIACFCAGWCKSCRGYHADLARLARAYPKIAFFWIDIEEHADLMGDLDIDKFPSILIQYRNMVTFFSCITADIGQLERIMGSLLREDEQELRRQTQLSEERRMWQQTCNMKQMLQRVCATTE
jgi:thiol-disulfide isomerase/thioredoxin